jgi:uncharacterized protein
MSGLAPPWRAEGDSLRLTIKALPRSRSTGCNGVVTISDTATALAVKLRSPPADGEANAELLSYLAKTLKVAPSRLSLIAGSVSRIKQIRIRGDASVLQHALEGLAEAH